MELIGAALGDGVDYAACGAAVLRGVVGRVDLKLLDGGFAGGIADARAAALFAEESLIVVGTIHRVVVEQARDPAKANQTKSAIGHGAGGAEREGGPATAIDGQIFDRSVGDIGGEVGAVGGDDRKLCGSYNPVVEKLHPHNGVDRIYAADVLRTGYRS